MIPPVSIAVAGGSNTAVLQYVHTHLAGFSFWWDELENDDSLVIGYIHNREAKAYPIDILHYHESVNDVVGGTPVTVGW